MQNMNTVEVDTFRHGTIGTVEGGATEKQTMEAFEKELTHLINRHSIENVADMPDFLLAGMICRIIEAMGPSIKKTLDWHGCDSVCHEIERLRHALELIRDGQKEAKNTNIVDYIDAVLAPNSAICLKDGKGGGKDDIAGIEQQTDRADKQDA